MSRVIQSRATLEDLYRTVGKAELIDGKIVHLMATGHKPARISFRIALSLDDYVNQTGKGVAYADNVGFAVAELASGRESFSPDASYYDGALPADLMRFIEGAPTFAAEVRSQNDYGPAAQAEMAEKCVDYFAAGTLVVWDVDPMAECMHLRRAAEPTHSFYRGQVADAEPAVPGWRVVVDWLFD